MYNNDSFYLVGDLSKEDKDYIEKVTAFINDDSFDEHYEYAGKFAVASTIEQWREELHPCCGLYSSTVVCPSGRHLVFCFDYGH